MSLQDKRVVVIGGTSGIGFATARAAAEDGAAVVIASNDADRVTQAAGNLPGGAEGRVVDVTSEAAVRRLFDEMGPFDHLVYTAGEPLAVVELGSLGLEQAHRSFEIRYWGAVSAAKCAAPAIRPGGSIALMSGAAGARPDKGWAVIASLAGAVEALARALAVELAPVRVNAVCPSFVRTQMWDGLPEQAREALYDSVGQKLLTGRVGLPEDIAQAHLFLMRDSFVTGTVLQVDGGARLV
jgi:NAD(P)-dependent dehydrogenase (short-subunit alcohol dehydrogenase family)